MIPALLVVGERGEAHNVTIAVFMLRNVPDGEGINAAESACARRGLNYVWSKRASKIEGIQFNVGSILASEG